MRNIDLINRDIANTEKEKARITQKLNLLIIERNEAVNAIVRQTTCEPLEA